MPAAREATPDWNLLPTELIGHICLGVEALERKDRYKIVPLLSKTWREAHKATPPLGNRWKIETAVSASQIGCFRSFCSSLEELSVDRSCVNKADALPQLLAYAASACPRLHSLDLVFKNFESHHNLSLSVFSAYMLSLGLLSQLRTLRLHNWALPGTLQGLEEIQQLTGLSSLEVTAEFFPEIFSLPRLAFLDITFKADAHADAFLASTSLTTLFLAGQSNQGDDQLNQLINPASPALASLQSLNLDKLRIKDFPGSMAAALSHLTHLGLTNNRFTRLPSSLSQISSLKSIDVTCNQNLELKLEDLEILRAMHNLETFYFIGESDGKIGCESVATMLSLKEEFPKVEIVCI